MDNKFIVPYFRAKALNKDYYVEGFYLVLGRIPPTSKRSESGG